MPANIAIINQSTVVADTDVAKWTEAIQHQVGRDFSTTWQKFANLLFVPKPQPIPSGYWQMAVLDNSDQAGALGYHDLTSEGMPLGKVFAKSDIDAGSSVSVTLSHEILEMILDPTINLQAEADDADGTPAFYAYEACDACEDDSYGYDINGVLVSDFVTPGFFNRDGSVFDFQKHITAPLQILPNGYLSVWRAATGWQQIFGQTASKSRRAPVGSRRERRRTPRKDWVRSTI